tara:strand:- start:130 stop:1260 length:1131 start_codon:yes stop_codon:yes gene_type:complete
MRKQLTIDNKEYDVVDAIQNFKAEDSFLHTSNKLKRYNGHGEGKKHIGSYAGKIGESRSHFFNYSKWGVPYKDPNKNRKSIESAKVAGAIVSNKCFFSKKNLIKYLKDAREEYFNQEQIYRNDISIYYDERLKKLESLKSNILNFSIYDNSDNWDQEQNRGYIKSDDKIWNIWREIILPQISYLSILKLKEKNNPSSEYFFFFRVFLHDDYRSIIDSDGNNNNQQNQNNTRIGQPYFKSKVHNHMPKCPFTNIDELKLLRASHIIPYKICETEKTWESNETIPSKYKRKGLKNYHSIDKYNGLTLSHTYDYLFDKGYITFLDDGQIICSSLFEDKTWENLRIDESKKYNIIPNGREKFLEYHRKKVFKDPIEFHIN